MKLARLCLSAGLLSVAIASSASALPFNFDAAPASDTVIPVVNGYGPLPYGLYGPHYHRHRHRNLPNGTGYHGRGTRTGGPSGGLPGRS